MRKEFAWVGSFGAKWITSDIFYLLSYQYCVHEDEQYYQHSSPGTRVMLMRVHLPTTLTIHRAFTISFRPQNSPFPHFFPPLSASTHRTAFSDYTGPDLFCSTVFVFKVIFHSFYFGSCGRLSWLNCQLLSAR